MKRILITGGAVHANLDAVKIITNKFKGGRIAELAEELAEYKDFQITYLTSRGSVAPKPHERIQVTYHTGFEDYKNQVLALAPSFHAVILGAAVCNLIPMNPWKGKFPSHNYKVGDKIPIDFTIAPRIIDEVKKVAPHVSLFGFKLLQGVPHQELIEAAYEIVLASKASCVFANDANDLNTKYAVTKERSVLRIPSGNYPSLSQFIRLMILDQHYHTVTLEKKDAKHKNWKKEIKVLNELTSWYKDQFDKTYGSKRYRFGTIAIRINNSNSFVTTARGKQEMEDITYVDGVDHTKRTVYVYPKKATLNAPLLHKIFSKNKRVKAIVHYHDFNKNYFKEGYCPIKYAPPGTTREVDVFYKDEAHGYPSNFVIDGHGTYLLLSSY